MTKINDDTIVRVCVSTRIEGTREYGNPRFLFSTTMANLRLVLGGLFPRLHRDGIVRVRKELETSVLSVLYDNNGSCYGIEKEDAS